MALGADIYYRYQTIADVNALHGSNVQFVYVKISDVGAASLNKSSALQQASQVRQAGKLVGGYQFAQSGMTSPQQQAQDMVSTLAAGHFDLVPMLDTELGVGGNAWVNAWISEYRALTGKRKVLVYASVSAWRNGALNAGAFDSDVLVCAARYYANDPTMSTLGWSDPHLAMYQYWDNGAVPGISGATDLDLAEDMSRLIDNVTEEDDVPIQLPPTCSDRRGDPKSYRDTVVAVGPGQSTVKIVASEPGPSGQYATLNGLYAMVANPGATDITSVTLVEHVNLVRFNGPTWAIPPNTTCLVVNYTHDGDGLSLTLW